MWKGKKFFKKTESSSVVDPNQNVSTNIPEQKKSNGIFINDEIRTKLVDAVIEMANKAKEEQNRRYNNLFNGDQSVIRYPE